MKDIDIVLKCFISFKPKFKTKTSSSNFSNITVTLENMYSAEGVQMTASGIVIISVISNCFLET